MAIKRSLFSFAGTLMLAIAAVVSTSGSSFFFGEPAPPKR